MTRLKQHVRDNWLAWGVIAAVFGMGFTGAWKPVTNRLSALEKDSEHYGDVLVEFIVRQNRLEADVKRIKCIVEAQALEVDPVGRCGL